MLGRLMKLLRRPTLSAKELQTAVGESQDSDLRPPVCRQLIRCLLLNFLLWAPGGYAVAWEVITLVSLPFSSILILIRILPKGQAFEECACVPGCCPIMDG